jgi:hypothetical protein
MAHNNDNTATNSKGVPAFEYFSNNENLHPVDFIAGLLPCGCVQGLLRPLDFADFECSLPNHRLSVQELHQLLDKRSILSTLTIRTVIRGYGKPQDPIRRPSYTVIRFGCTVLKTPIFASKGSVPMTTSTTTWTEFARFRPLIWSIGSTMEKLCTLEVFRGLVAVGCGHPPHIGT